MPRPRLGLKSRTGCRQCKRRRVKCDERSPICGDCSRLQLDCSFVSITPHLWSMKPLRRGQGDERWGAPTQRPGPVPQGILSSQRLHSLQASLSEEPPQYTLEDMRLLYHFSNHTAMTLSDVPEAQLAWGTSAIQVAFKHPFLLQGILALSALHLTSLEGRTTRETERLSIVAASKQDAALREFRSKVGHITRQNCNSPFAFSFLTEFYIPASAGTVINPSATFMNNNLFEAVLDWLRLHRGTSDIYKRHGDWLAAGPLAALFWGDVLMVLVDIFSRTQIFNKPNQATTAELHRSPRQFQSDQHPPNVVNKPYYLGLSFSWLFRVPARYVELLERRQPASLIIFAHFALLLHNAPRFWWNKGMSAKIVKAVSAVLPAQCQQYIKLPIQEIL
ncbi:hypothetical protein M441DRAFT_139346 [Trichoderma asperellum CBS 433.97]|uniref:Zn(2)-C6 fungal-type domain-containing protein n=1 Tax=Trichoderma asperellum (strain ATCC 204424 / CBS 433.97 / NBRC 101777) TaxID=1042311 RepID=A0A2T3ZAU4_TRIA4|nr:hypothetical protein M441DRAFT_139346 [Trichoderma asperellum CBS 433.97]PTB41916.1 hypothetical protein M441DRAFT_139346 [Trichoderma asperellum CBS 433.97]